MKKSKSFAFDFLLIVLIIATVWGSVSTAVQAVKCPHLTQTELFLKIPNSFICNWENC